MSSERLFDRVVCFNDNFVHYGKNSIQTFFVANNSITLPSSVRDDSISILLGTVSKYSPFRVFSATCREPKIQFIQKLIDLHTHEDYIRYRVLYI